MSVASVSAANANPYLQPLLELTGSAGAKKVSDPLAALFGAFTGSSYGGPPADGSQAAAPETGTPPVSGLSGSPLSATTLSALISLQGQQSGDTIEDPLSAVFGKFDADRDGLVTKTEFETAIGEDADAGKVAALFGKIDGDGNGDVTKDELATAIQRAHGIGGDDTGSGDTGQSQGASANNANLMQQLIKLQSQYLTQAVKAALDLAPI